MRTFKEAVEDTHVQTHNGADTLSTSKNPLVDLFFTIGSARNMDKQELSSLFTRSYVYDSDKTLRILLWSRDIRGGAGERDTFRWLLKHVNNNYPEKIRSLVNKIPEVGRYDDLFAIDGENREIVLQKINEELLINKNSLCAKWMPREKSSNRKIAFELMRYMDLTPIEYRKMLSKLTNVVETKMSNKEWNTINFSSVPSVAHSRYRNAFSRNSDTYQDYLDKLASGDKSVKVNANAIFPHDVIKGIYHSTHTEYKLIKSQWEALPNPFKGTTENCIIPMVDVSGSMTCNVGGNSNLTCADVALAMGMFIADKQEGEFKDAFLTFSSECKLEYLVGDIKQKYKQLSTSEWGLSTNILNAFMEILKVAVENKVPQSEMPKTLIVFSDMEFDEGVDGETIDQTIQTEYSKHGYELPTIVWWNLHARQGNVPVTADAEGKVLVSGFSPHIIKSIINGEGIPSPEKIMMDTIMVERYNYLD